MTVKHSLRIRLLIRVIGAVLLLLSLFTVGVYIMVRSALFRQFDASLVSIGQILAASVELDGDEIELEFEVEQMPEFQERERPTYYQLWRDDGTVVAKSALLDNSELPRLQGSLRKPAFETISGSGGRIKRAAGFTFMPGISDSDRQPVEKRPLYLAVARDSTVVLNQLWFLRWVLFVVSAAVTFLSVVVAVPAVHQGLRPLNTIATEIAAIREDDLTARVGTKTVPSELLPVKDRLNDLLCRLEAAFSRERQFTSDVAHELRTPLAGIRSTIEVTLVKKRESGEYQNALCECLVIVRDMQAMVNNLLMLARLEAQQISFRTEQIGLGELVDSCWRPFSDKAINREISFENRIDPEIVCQADRQNLSIALSNILENAVEYADEGGHIWTTACRKDDSVEITVSNTGCELTTEEISQVFECFWRGEPSRSEAGVHCGLGLALVRRIVKALGGDCATQVKQDGTFTIRVALPSPTLNGSDAPY